MILNQNSCGADTRVCRVGTLADALCPGIYEKTWVRNPSQALISNLQRNFRIQFREIHLFSDPSKLFSRHPPIAAFGMGTLNSIP